MNLSTKGFGDIGKVLDGRRTEEKRFSRDIGKGLWKLHAVEFLKNFKAAMERKV
jgi:hypothetical protein